MDVENDMLDRLKAQYSASPIILALIEQISVPMQDTFDVVEWIINNSAIDTAEGEQLDFIGELIGSPRPPLQETNLFTLVAQGEFEDRDNCFGFRDDTDSDVTTGGYLPGVNGLVDQSDQDAQYSDEDYRVLILRKAASFRSKMTRLNLFNYVLGYGARVAIDDDTDHVVIMDPSDQDALTQFERWHILNRGFKPAGTRVEFETTRRGDTI